MAAPAAFAGQFGYVSEVTPGTAVAVSKFLPVLSSGLKQDIDRVPFKGHRAGRLTQWGWKAGRKKVGGAVKLQLPNKDVAALLKHCFGAVTTTGAGPYTHTCTPGELAGKSMTMQVGRPDVSGTVQPFTYAGCKVAGWELACEVGGAVELSLDVVAMTEVTGIALATASYTSGIAPFVFTEAALTIAGSAVAITKFSLKGDNGLDGERFKLGSATAKEPLPAKMRPYTGEVSADFESLTAYNRFVNGTEAALVVTLTSGADTLTITTNVEFDGKTPELPDEGLLEQPLPFTCTSSTSDAAAITAVLVNGDSSAA